MVMTLCLRKSTEKNLTCFQGKTGNYKRESDEGILKNRNTVFWKTNK